MWPAIIAAGATLAGGMMTNEANSAQSADNRTFQANMSNTSFQRGMADMRAAGLNPMLAYSHGGASVPVGAQARLDNPMIGAVQSFNQYQTAETGAEVGSAQAGLTRAQTKTEGFRAAVANNDAIKGNYAVMQLAGQLDAAMEVTGKAGAQAIAAIEVPRVKAGLMELRAALASAKNDADVYEALNSRGVQLALDILGRVTGGGGVAGAVDRYRARSQRGDIINLNKE